MKKLFVVSLLVLVSLGLNSATSSAVTPDWNRRALKLELTPPSDSLSSWAVRCSASVTRFTPAAENVNLDTQLRVYVNNSLRASDNFTVAAGGAGNCACYGGCTEYCDVSDFGCWCGYIVTGVYALGPLTAADFVRYELVAAPTSEAEQYTNDDFIVRSTVGVEPGPSPYRGDYVRIMSENPTTRASIRIQYNTVNADPVQLAVYNLAGRKVKVLTARSAQAGTRELVWTATDDAGRLLSPGVYLVQMSGARKVVSTRVIILR